MDSPAEISLLDAICNEIEMYIEKFEYYNDNAIMIFPNTTNPFTEKCIEMVTGMVDLMLMKINGYIIIGRSEDFSLSFLDSSLKNSTCDCIIQSPLDIRNLYDLPLLYFLNYERKKSLVNVLFEKVFPFVGNYGDVDNFASKSKESMDTVSNEGTNPSIDSSTSLDDDHANGYDNEMNTIWRNFKFEENGQNNIYETALDMTKWIPDCDAEELLSKILKYFGMNATIVLVSQQYIITENNPLYKLTHVVNAYEIPQTTKLDSACNVKSYIRWCTHNNAILLTRSSTDAKIAKTESQNFKTRFMKDASPLALLTAYSNMPNYCYDYYVKEDS